MHRIKKYSGCSQESVILALIYIDKILCKSDSLTLKKYNIHRLIDKNIFSNITNRLLITSIMLAAKFFDDTYLYN